VKFPTVQNNMELSPCEDVDRNPKPRPPRFPIQTVFRYRESGAALWRRGVTIDISRSGVLFHAEYRLPPKTVLEMQIGFPPEMTGGVAANILCCGPVVRTVAAVPPFEQPLIAALFLNYRFAHL